MQIRLLVASLVATTVGLAQLPELKVEAVDGGSVLVVKNASASQALTAFLIELVDYPGSSYAFSQDHLALGSEPLGPGQSRRFPTLNMTLGSSPEYVKLVAALFADGSSAGSAAKADQLVARRNAYRATTLEVAARIRKGESAAALERWADSLPVSSASKSRRADPEVVTQTLLKEFIRDCAKSLQASSEPNLLAGKLAARAAALAPTDQTR